MYFSFLGSSLNVSADESVTALFDEKSDTTIVRRAIMPADIRTHRNDYLTGNQVPDLVTWISSREDTEAVREGLFTELSSLWQQEEWLQEAPEALKGASRSGRDFYIIPFKVGTWKIYYRNSIFVQHGLSEPQNWDEFIAVCSALHNAGITPIAVGSKFRWPAAAWLEYVNLRVNGSSYHKKLLNGEESFLSSKAKKSFDLFADLIRSGFFPAATLENSWGGAIRDFESGVAAMYLFNDTFPDSLSDPVRADTGTFHFPEIAGGISPAVIGTVQGWIIPGKARRSAGAREFLRFIGSEAGKAAASALPELPLFKGSYGSSLDLPPAADTIVPELIRLAAPQLLQPLYNAVSRIVADPSEETVASVLSALEQERGKIPQSN